MTDVIFNGSSSRKPVGQASVELVFDNHDKKLRGEYVNFAEVSIKRKVDRDAQSTYSLNGIRCRRKDITDIFLVLAWERAATRLSSRAWCRG